MTPAPARRGPPRDRARGDSRAGRDDRGRDGDARPTRNTRSPRAVAVAALMRVEDGAYAHLSLPDVLRRSDLSGRDRAFVTELVYGTLREQQSLDRALRKHSRRPIDELDPDVRAALRMGAYQLVHGMSPHAAVGETVSTVDGKVRGVVNAVLRSLQDGGLPDPHSPGYVRGSYPRWIVEDLEAAYGVEDTAATLAAMNEPPAATLRVHAGRGTVESVIAEVEAAGGTVERGALLADALIVRGAGDLARLDAIRDGRASVQDQSSQAVAALLEARPGEHVLDVAAAPGGKSAAVAEAMGDTGVVCAGDRHEGRVAVIRRGTERLALGSVVAFVADGRHLPFARDSFDRVLLDAPCSGLGVLRRRPDARHRVTREMIAEVAGLQRDLLVEAATMVKPGGRLVFSVCTLTRTETAGIDAFAASELPELVAVAPPGPPWRRVGRGAVLLPHVAGTDGMFVLVLDRAR